MTVSVQETVFPYVGNGVTVSFAYQCQILSAADLYVFVNDVQVTSGFTVDGIGSKTGGNVTFTSPPGINVPVRLERIVSLERNIDYGQNGDFKSNVVNPDFDRIWMALQQFERMIGTKLGAVARVLKLGSGDTNGSGAYRAQQNRIQDLASPINQGDATNRAFVEASILNAVSFGIGAIPVVNSITGLKALNKASVQRVLVTGYYASGDGGGGNYYYDSADTASADNGGTIIVATDGGRWKLSQSYPVSPKQFGAKADGATDDTSKIQAALTAVLYLDFGGSGNSYKITNELTLRTGHVLKSNGATITQTAIRTAIFRATSVNDISISGFKFAGVGTDFNDSPSSLAVAVRGTTVARAKVFNNYFNNFSCAAAFFDFSSDVEVCDNVIVGPGSPTLTAVTSGACYGVVVDGDRMLVSGNSITKTAQGIATGDGKDSIRIADNTIYNIVGQHGIYAGAGLTNLVISDNTVASTALIGIKVQNYDTPALNADNITITGNSVSSTGSHGIAVLSTTASAVYKLRNVTIVGNSIRTTTEDGINLGDITIGTVAGNTIYGSSREGITIGRLTSVRISDNTIREAARNGIRESAACTGCAIVDNTIQNCSSALVVGEKNGILIQLGDTFTIDGNVISDSASKMQYGLFISGGTQNGMIVRNNVCRGMTEYGARFKSPAEGFLAYSDNYFSGTTGPVLNDPPLPIVASASTITLPVGAKMVRISGTSTINTINTSGHAANQPVTLLFDSTAVVTRNGANILINATFNATQYDTLTIFTDGSIWYEVARALN